MAFGEFLALDKIPSNRFYACLLCALALIVPGFCYVYLTYLDMFKELNVIKLIIISIMFSTPLLIISLVAPLKFNKTKKEKEFRFISIASYNTLIGFMGAIVIHSAMVLIGLKVSLAVVFYGFPFFMEAGTIIKKEWDKK